MAGILDLLQGETGKQLIEGISKQTGVSGDKVGSVATTALPLLMGAMQKNMEDGQGAMGLLNALKSDKHDGSLVSNLGGLLAGGKADSILSEGSGILGHLLGGKQEVLENAVSKQTGVDSSSVSKIIKMLAPTLMSFLGKKVTDEKVDSTSGLGSMLSGVLGTSKGGNMLTSLLDSDGDGSVLDDVAGMIFSGKKDSGKKGGSLLDGLF